MRLPEYAGESTIPTPCNFALVMVRRETCHLARWSIAGHPEEHSFRTTEPTLSTPLIDELGYIVSVLRVWHLKLGFQLFGSVEQVSPPPLCACQRSFSLVLLTLIPTSKLLNRAQTRPVSISSTKLPMFAIAISELACRTASAPLRLPLRLPLPLPLPLPRGFAIVAKFGA